jgi:hypothetical protein
MTPDLYISLGLMVGVWIGAALVYFDGDWF